MLTFKRLFCPGCGLLIGIDWSDDEIYLYDLVFCPCPEYPVDWLVERRRTKA